MKYTDVTTILWDFKRMFGNNYPVWAEVDAKHSKQKKSRFRLAQLFVSSSLYRKREVQIIIFADLDSSREDQYGGLYSMNFADTLCNVGEDKKGFIPHDSMSAYWELQRGENFSDGSIRIARRIFQALNIQVSNLDLSQKWLLSQFVMYKRTFVRRSGCNVGRYEDELCRKHELVEGVADFRHGVLL